MTSANTFVNSVNAISKKTAKKANVTVTANGAKAFKSSLNANVDFFGRCGSMRGHDITSLFVKAFEEDAEMALRNILNLRDIRGGKGERELYRQVLKYLAINKPNVLLSSRILEKTIEVGRWDDLLFVFNTAQIDSRIVGAVVELIKVGINNKDALCAKWLPKNGYMAAIIRRHLGYSPKFYRKTLVAINNVVETKMCNNDWDNINFSHVPSKAMSIYSNAFAKQATDKFNDYKLALTNGEVKINANAVFPYEVYKKVISCGNGSNQPIFEAMWNSLPNYIPSDINIIPMIDVSGSMSCPVGGNSNISCMDMSISLGAYVATKAKGVYNGLYLTFDTVPQIDTVYSTTSILDAFNSIRQANWGGSTDIEAAFKLILEVAVKNAVSQADMPTHLIIFSDMQFDIASNNRTAQGTAKKLYEKAGYELPKIIYWNLNAFDNVPVKFDTNGTALVSGYSPSILKAVLSNKFEDACPMTPKDVMIEALNNERYNPY